MLNDSARVRDPVVGTGVPAGPVRSLHSPHPPKGVGWLQNPSYNKGTAFTEAERDALGLHGLLPPRVFTPEEQVLRVISNYRRKSNDLEKYVFLIALQDRNETLFYRVIMEHFEEMLPIVYTPTVGLACQEYGSIFRRPRGLYISANDRGRVEQILRNWPHIDVRVVVATDGERILGLGDLGAHGMGIPVGKLSLYTACAGIPPHACLPVTLDTGTNNETLRRQPLYTGLPQARLRGEPYDALLEEFVTAIQRVFPRALIQFEDFATANAFGLLKRYRDRVCAFNDDIQGTAAVTLSGVTSALRLTAGRLADQLFLICGAGSAGIGIGDLLTSALAAEGLPPVEARRRCWFVDSKGLVVRGRGRLAEHKLPYAHDHPSCPDLLAAVQTLKPTVLIGVSGERGCFTRPVIEAMAATQTRPVVFALSNPTSKAECTAEEAYTWSGGRAIFAGGSPFPPVRYEGRLLIPGQANNAYVFPGVGLGVVAAEATRVTDSMFFAAARALAELVGPSDLEAGRIFPKLERIREVSAAIASAVGAEAYRLGLAHRPNPEALDAEIRALMYQPVYPRYA